MWAAWCSFCARGRGFLLVGPVLLVPHVGLHFKALLRVVSIVGPCGMCWKAICVLQKAVGAGFGGGRKSLAGIRSQASRSLGVFQAPG